ncbi:hypothetical protein ACHAO4_006839 [Trichoderma viride]
MGCCFSHSAGPNSPHPGGVPDASSRAGNPPLLTLPEAILSGGSQAGSSLRRRRRDQAHRDQPRRERPPLDQHINRPLRKHEWTSGQRRWTRRELAKEREEFFETRVVCRPEIWQTLHAALQVLWDANPEDSQDEDSALATAQTILNAAEISLPTGDLVNGAYDSLGNLYALPEYIVSDPDNLADDDDADFKGDTSTAEDDTAGEEDDVDSEEAERRREEKGKGVLDEREMVTLRARLSETGQDIIVPVTKTDSVRSVVKKITDISVAPSEKKIRLAYMGKILKENASLEAQGWQVGHVINALVFNR